MKTYKITWDDGTERYRKLDEADLKRWKAQADSKTSSVASVVEGTPTPTGASVQPARRSQDAK